MDLTGWAVGHLGAVKGALWYDKAPMVERILPIMLPSAWHERSGHARRRNRQFAQVPNLLIEDEPVPGLRGQGDIDDRGMECTPGLELVFNRQTPGLEKQRRDGFGRSRHG